MIKCIVVEDEPLALKLIKSYIEQNNTLQLMATFSDPHDALEFLKRVSVQLIFLDIQMPSLSGIELASHIDTFKTKVVFTTAFAHYALDGFRVDAVDYLLKPISIDAFERSVRKVERLIGSSSEIDGTAIGNYIVVKSDHKLIKVYYNEILYLESLGDYVMFELSDGSQMKTLSTLKGIASTLPSDIFVRVHRSFIVNLSKVKITERNTIIFGKKIIPISESYRTEVFRCLGLK